MLESLKHNKQNFIILSVILSTIAIPVAYSVTEPNIIIDMITDQTTNPFTILNATGDPVLSISPEGAVNGLHHVFFTTNYEDPISVGVDDIENDPIVLALWEVEKGVVIENQRLFIRDGVLNALIQRDSGGASIEIAWAFSTDGGFGNWIQVSTTAESTTGVFEESVNQNGGFTLATANFIAVLAYNNDGASTGQIKSFIATADIIISPDMTLVRII